MRILFPLVMAAMLSGCQQKSGEGTAAGVGAAGTTAQPQSTSSTRVRQGTAPMSYMLGGGGKIRIVDTTADKELIKTTAPPQSIIQIDPTAGIRVGQDRLLKGPLPKDHRYEIWLDR